MSYKKYSEEFIQQLVESVDLLDYISQYLELKKQGRYYFAICPLHEEDDASFCVNEDKQAWCCYGCDKGGNIITFAMEYHKLSYPQAVEYLSKYSGIEPGEDREESQTLKFLKQFNKKKNKTIQHKILSPNILNQFQKQPIFEWLCEGIEQEIMEKYGVRYDPRNNSAVFPIWDNYGNLINIKARTLYEDYKQLGIPKYIYYYELGCNDFLYPLHFKKEIIKKTGEVLVFEGAKSIWKCEGWGILNCISLETSNINQYQIKQLIEIKADLVFCLDNNVDIDKLRDKINVLTKFTNVYLVLDKKNLLGEKDSPCDKGFEIFQELYRNKIKL